MRIPACSWIGAAFKSEKRLAVHIHRNAAWHSSPPPSLSLPFRGLDRERETMSHVRFGHQRGRLRLRSRLASSNSDKNDHGSLAKTRTFRRSRGVVVQDRLVAECDHREYSDHVLQIPTIFEPFLEWPKFYNLTNYCPEGKGFARS